MKWSPSGHQVVTSPSGHHRLNRLNLLYILACSKSIYIGINAHVTPADGQTDGHVKVEQYSAEAESAKRVTQCEKSHSM